MKNERVVEEREEGERQLVQIGGRKKKPEMFKTSVLGLKNPKNTKKGNLSFEEDL